MKDGNRRSQTFRLSRRFIVNDTNQSKDLLKKNEKQPPSRTRVTSHICALHEHTGLANELLRLLPDNPQRSACLFKVTWMNQTVFTCCWKPFLISLFASLSMSASVGSTMTPAPWFNPNIRANSEQEARERRQIKHNTSSCTYRPRRRHERHADVSLSCLSSTSNTQILLGSGGERLATQPISLNYY